MSISRSAGPPTDTAFAARRINVIGTSAAGKSMLADQLRIPHIELDALHWEADWTEVSPEVMRERVAAAIAGNAWVVDGNYAVVRDLVWARAETIVWLDLPLRTILWRFAVRTSRRIVRREELWNGNRERLRTQLASRDSLLLWILSTFRRRRREYPARLAARPDLVAVRLRSARAAREWLMSVERGLR